MKWPVDAPKSWLCTSLPNSEVTDLFQYLEIGHSGNTYHPETGKCYKSGLGFSLPAELIVNHDQHTLDGKSFRISVNHLAMYNRTNDEFQQLAYSS